MAATKHQMYRPACLQFKQATELKDIQERKLAEMKERRLRLVEAGDTFFKVKEFTVKHKSDLDAIHGIIYDLDDKIDQVLRKIYKMNNSIELIGYISAAVAETHDCSLHKKFQVFGEKYLKEYFKRIGVDVGDAAAGTAGGRLGSMYAQVETIVQELGDLPLTTAWSEVRARFPGKRVPRKLVEDALRELFGRRRRGRRPNS